MLKRYTIWFWAAVVFQFLTAVFHSISLFVKPEPANETERQLFTLLTTYKMDGGAGFHPTFSHLMTALSSCFTLLCVFAGLVNAFLLRKNADTGIMNGVLLINLLIFGVLFVIMAVLTFLPPIVMSGLIFVCLVIAFITFKTQRPANAN